LANGAALSVFNGTGTTQSIVLNVSVSDSITQYTCYKWEGWMKLPPGVNPELNLRFAGDNAAFTAFQAQTEGGYLFQNNSGTWSSALMPILRRQILGR
jgi:hypothetical protein